MSSPETGYIVRIEENKEICLHCLEEITYENIGQQVNGDTICLKCINKANNHYKEIMSRLQKEGKL